MWSILIWNTKRQNFILVSVYCNLHLDKLEYILLRRDKFSNSFDVLVFFNTKQDKFYIVHTLIEIANSLYLFSFIAFLLIDTVSTSGVSVC